MKSQDLKKYKLPDNPGVYIFKRGRIVLYIGKATSLADRVKSYFAKDIAFVRSLLIENMVREATGLKWIETGSVLEALILEANLIKKHKPKYNTKEKDDKSFNFVVITKEEFPRVFTVRGHELQKLETRNWKLDKAYGPFTSGTLLKEALKIIRRIFPFRGEKQSKSPLEQQLGLAPGEKVDKKEYAKTIKNLKLFFQGRYSNVLKNLRTEMKGAAKQQEFEKAEEIKRKIFALEHINDIALVKADLLKKNSDALTLSPGAPTPIGIFSNQIRIEAYDVAHISGKDRVGVMVVVEGGEAKKSDYRKFKIRTKKEGDTDALAEVLERRLNHTEWLLPKIIVVDGGRAQKNVAEKVLKEFGYQIPVVAVTKGEGHRPKGFLGSKILISKKESEILLANSEAHRFAIKYHKSKRKIV